MNHYGKHFVAIIGGSVAGSEAALLLAEKGYRVVVFDQNLLPYGKIEDGLPKWHVGLRNKEEMAIDNKLGHENVRFVPGFTLGKDAKIDELINNWGFSAVIIAIGAWHDRKIAIEGIEKYYNKGVVKQNDLVYWFNHKHEVNYAGPRYKIVNNTAVIGGGLASLDMVKICMIEIVQEALQKHKGVDLDIFTLEKRGVAKVLAEHKTTLAKLNIQPCTLFYRREAEDMPLYSRKDKSPEVAAHARRVAKKLLDNWLAKYMFNFVPRSVPKAVIEEDGSLKGIVFQRIDIRDGNLVEIEGDTFDFKTDLVISSIGSLPEETPSLPISGNMLKTYGVEGFKVEGFKNVFAIGNVVTGRGNIIESRKHGRQTTDRIIDQYLEPLIDADPLAEEYEDQFRKIENDIAKKINNIATSLKDEKILNNESVNRILGKTKELQSLAGYDGNYSAWVEQHRPERLEDIINSTTRS